MIKFMLNGKETAYAEEKLMNLVDVLIGNFDFFGVKEGYKDINDESLTNSLYN